MSIEPPSHTPADSASGFLDLTGLPGPVADELRRLVETLRRNLSPAPPPGNRTTESSEPWSGRLQAWIDSHPNRPCTIVDSRESLYAGREE